MCKQAKWAELKRIFIVGPPRSGTTLLQSRLGLNSQIAVYPETGFFACIDPQYPFNHPLLSERFKETKNALKEARRTASWIVDQAFSPLRRFGVINPHRARRAFRDVRKAVGGDQTEAGVGVLPVSLAMHVERFVEIMDESTLDLGKLVWIEKSPHHLFHIETIEQFVPDAKFIHTRRPPIDNAASLYDAALRYGGFWNRFRDLDAIILVLNASAEETKRFAQSSNHVIVKYSEMTTRTEEVLSQLCKFIGVPFEECMLDKPNNGSQKFFHAHEQWKNGVLEPIYSRTDERFESLFTLQEQEYLTSRLLDF